MKLNKKGFTLVELLAVIIILSVLMAIMVPTTNHIINKNNEDNCQSLKAGIINATKVYISDNRYNITLSESCENNTRQIKNIGSESIDESKIPIATLISKGYLKAKNGEVVNPKTKEKLDKSSIAVGVEFDCITKEYTYKLLTDFCGQE